MKIKFGQQSGFTLLEVIVVLVLIGILSLAALTRVSHTDAELIGDADRLTAHLRYAQSRSIRTSSVWSVVFLTASSYQLQQDGTARFLPGLETPTITVGSTIAAGGNVSFNSWGEPSVAGAPLAAAATITVSDGISSESITIEPDTGYVHD